MVTINVTIGENGLITRAKELQNYMTNAQLADEELINDLLKEIEETADKNPIFEEIYVSFSDPFDKHWSPTVYNATMSIYTDKECKNLVKRIEMLPQDYETNKFYKINYSFTEEEYYFTIDNADAYYLYEENKDDPNFVGLQADEFMTASYVVRYRPKIDGDGIIIELIPKNSERTPMNPNDSVSLNIEISDTNINMETNVRIYEIGSYNEYYDEYTWIDELSSMYNCSMIKPFNFHQGDSFDEIKRVIEEGNLQPTKTISVSLKNGVTKIPTKLKPTSIYCIYIDDVYLGKYKFSFPPFLYKHINSWATYKNNDIIYQVLSERTEASGKLEIAQSITNYNQNAEKPIFVYGVEGVKNGERVYSDIVSIIPDGEGGKTIILDGLPIETEVTVTNIYSSLGYERVTGDTQVVFIGNSIAETPIVNFSYDGSIEMRDSEGTGTSIRYEYDDEYESWNATIANNEDSGETKKIDMEIDFTDRRQRVGISNNSEEDYFIRVAVFASNGLEINNTSSEGWSTSADGKIYYNDIVAVGSSITELMLPINPDELFSNPEQGANVVIAVEYCSVSYDDYGNPYADWDAVKP